MNNKEKRDKKESGFPITDLLQLVHYFQLERLRKTLATIMKSN